MNRKPVMHHVGRGDGQPERRAPTVGGGLDLGPCAYCLLPLVPGVGEEVEHARSAGHDGRLRYFCAASPDALHHAEPRFCVETADGWQHLIRADVATDAGLDVDRAFCPEHDAAPGLGEGIARIARHM